MHNGSPEIRFVDSLITLDSRYTDTNRCVQILTLMKPYLQPMKPLNASSSNYSAPRVVFRKSKKAKGRVDDVIFINLLQQVRFIAEHFQHNERESEVVQHTFSLSSGYCAYSLTFQISDDWTFVAMVLDRLFLLIFSVLNVGTMFIILEAPSLYDYSEAMNITVPSKPLGQANLFGSHSRSV
ncbi:unnamed protein product [Cylicostephanus goldi]|uniref:Neurotransmitter-gated ion-channel transmembrane domain-containing protein n=1 Tax=Cylicostephanus goldi TaxID=71465 RepID=A0A3P6R9H1_CYLGO|nr:unnamed protein product [Cylicostephanus goldi]